MNMLLAIIVDSYAHVKGQTKGKRGLISDLANVSWHGIRRWVATTSRSHFVSDQKFLQALKEELKQLASEGPRTQKEAAQQVVDTHHEYGHHQVVLLPGAPSVTKTDMAKYPRFVPVIDKMTSGMCCSLLPTRSRAAGFARGNEWEGKVLEGGDAVYDLMQRYGSDVSCDEHKERKNKELYDMIQIENRRRVLSLQIGQSKLLDETREIQDMVVSSWKQSQKVSKANRPSIFPLHAGDSVHVSVCHGWSVCQGRLLFLSFLLCVDFGSRV